MKILIADDEKLARARLRALVGEIYGAEVIAEAANGRDALYLSNAHDPDIVLMDIRMPGMDGLEAAMHLTRMEKPPAVIFTTAYGDYALGAFQAHAVDYLLKPVRKERLEEALSNARRLSRVQLASLEDTTEPVRQRTHVSVHSRGNIHLVAVSDIVYFHADQKYVTLRHRSGEVLIDESLKSLEEEFGDRFVRIHRNALVAVAYLAGLGKERDGRIVAELDGTDDRLEVSRRHIADVRACLKEKERA